MTSGQPQPPDEPTPDTASVAPDPNVAHAAGSPGGPTPPVDPAKAMGPGAVAVVLGGLGCVVPLVPLDLAGDRGYLALAFALPGLVVGIVGCTGRRRGNTLAVAGSILSGIALGLAVVLLISSARGSSPNTSPDDHTQEVLTDDLDVRFGEVHANATGDVSWTVTLHNKGVDTASFMVTIEEDGDDICESSVNVDELAPGASYLGVVNSCTSLTSPKDFGLQVTKATKE